MQKIVAQQVSQRAFPAIYQSQMVVPAAQPRLPAWLEEQLDKHSAKEIQQNKPAPLPAREEVQAPSSTAETSEVEGTYYEVYVGARLRLFSTKKQEEHLRNMHEVNHRELPVARLAARVADLLWPNCQEIVDDAIAKSKGTRRRLADLEEVEFVPPHVPEFLPVTSWIRNSASLRESFVCDKNTRYKPRMSWYNPNDGMIPSDWWTQGFLADLAYYKPFTGTREEHQKI